MLQTAKIEKKNYDRFKR